MDKQPIETAPLDGNAAFARFAARMDEFRQKGFQIAQLNISREEAEGMRIDAERALGGSVSLNGWLNAITLGNVSVYGVVLGAGWRHNDGVKVSVIEPDGSTCELGSGKVSFRM